MDFKTPCQIFLGSLLAAFALSVVGLAADNVAFANKNEVVDIHYNRWNQTEDSLYSYWVAVDYEPSRFSMGTMYAMIVACLISLLVGVGVAVTSWMMRGHNALTTSFAMKKRPAFLPTTLVLTTIAFLLSLAVAIYVWHPVMRWPIDFQKSLPLPPAGSAKTPVTYQSPFAFTPDVWNCFLFPYVVDPPQAQKLQGLCREANIAKYLMIPTLLLSAALLGCLVWTWRQARLAAAHTEEKVQEIEVASVQGQE